MNNDLLNQDDIKSESEVYEIQSLSFKSLKNLGIKSRLENNIRSRNHYHNCGYARCFWSSKKKVRSLMGSAIEFTENIRSDQDFEEGED